MSIVSSVIASDSAQKDGRRWIEEQHTDQLGAVYRVLYLVEAAFDATAAMNARAAGIYAARVQAEIDGNVAQVLARGSLAVPVFIYSTAGANAIALRTAYLSATQVQAIMVGDYLSSLSNATLQSIFSMTAGQVTTLRSNKLTPAATAAATIRAATGA